MEMKATVPETVLLWFFISKKKKPQKDNKIFREISSLWHLKSYIFKENKGH